MKIPFTGGCLCGAMPPSSPDKLREMLSELDQRWAKLREDSPNIPGKICRESRELLAMRNTRKDTPCRRHNRVGSKNWKLNV